MKPKFLNRVGTYILYLSDFNFKAFFIKYTPFFASSIVKERFLKEYKKMPASYLVLVRHGQSLWNEKNLFTGWEDIDLSAKGMEQARETGALLKKKGLSFDCAYTSLLKRAIRTLWLLLDEMDLMRIPVTKSWKLNERYYGALQGMNKKEAMQKYGEAQVMKWRRGFSSAPPPAIPHKKEMKNTLRARLPASGSESLKDTQLRVLSFWNECILPQIKRQNQSVLISAHGNSLRALIKHLEGISDKDIFHLNIKTGEPVIYRMNSDGAVNEKES